MASPDKSTLEGGGERKFEFESDSNIDLQAGFAHGQQITLPGGLEFLVPSPLGHTTKDASKVLSKSVTPELSGYEAGKESTPSLTLSPALSRSESSTDSSTTDTALLAPKQKLKSTQTIIEIQGRALVLSSPSTTKPLGTSEQPIRSSKALQATRDSAAKPRAREPRNRIASRLQKLSQKKAKRMVNEKDPKFCPGVDKCRSLTCNHTNLRNAAPYEINEAVMKGKAKVVVDECKDRGYKISLGYVRERMMVAPNATEKLVNACTHDIDCRESLLKTSGRFPFNEEIVAACDTTGRDERDISLEWMEKEERLFKDVEINGQRSVWGMRVAYALDQAEGQRWLQASTREAKYRTSRAKHFETLRVKVVKGEITHEYMNTCLDRIDGAQVQIRLNHYREFLSQKTNAQSQDSNGIKWTERSAQSSSALISPVQGVQGTFASLGAFGPNMKLLSLPVRVAASSNEKSRARGCSNEKRANRQAYFEDDIDSTDSYTISEEILRARAGEAFKILYGRDLPSYIELSLVERFANTLPIFDPDPVEMTEMKKAIDGLARFRPFVADLFETHVIRAESCMDREKYFGVSYADIPKLINREHATASALTIRSEQDIKASIAAAEVKHIGQPELGKAIAESLKDAQPVPRAAPTQSSLFKSMAKAKIESMRKEDGTLDEQPVSSEMRARAILASESVTQSAQAQNASLLNTTAANARNCGKSKSAGHPKDNVQFRIKLAQKKGEMTWPPRAVNFMATGFDKFLGYEDARSSKLLGALALLQIDIVGGMMMIEDGPSKEECVAYIKEMTTITSDRLAHLFLGLGSKSAALAAHLYHKFEVEVDHYFVEQEIVPYPPDFENEALRFALWMYMARDLDTDGNSKVKEQKKESKLEQLGKEL